MSEELVEKLALKLNIKDKMIINKSCEILRLSRARSNLGLQNVPEVAKVIASIEIASSKLSTHFDKIEAVKLSSLSKVNYQKLRNNLEVSLGVSSGVNSVKLETLLMKLGVPELEGHVKNTLDVSNGCKVDRNELKEFSRCRWTEVERISKEMDVASKLASNTNSKAKKRKQSEENIEEDDKDEPEGKTCEKEDYETWKQRILDEAKEN